MTDYWFTSSTLVSEYTSHGSVPEHGATVTAESKIPIRAVYAVAITLAVALTSCTEKPDTEVVEGIAQTLNPRRSAERTWIKFSTDSLFQISYTDSVPVFGPFLGRFDTKDQLYIYDVGDRHVKEFNTTGVIAALHTRGIGSAPGQIRTSVSDLIIVGDSLIVLTAEFFEYTFETQTDRFWAEQQLDNPLRQARTESGISYYFYLESESLFTVVTDTGRRRFGKVFENQGDMATALRNEGWVHTYGNCMTFTSAYYPMFAVYDSTGSLLYAQRTMTAHYTGEAQIETRLLDKDSPVYFAPLSSIIHYGTNVVNGWLLINVRPNGERAIDVYSIATGHYIGSVKIPFIGRITLSAKRIAADKDTTVTVYRHDLSSRIEEPPIKHPQCF